MANLRLVTIPFSHYCEKARWALDRLGLEYDEEAHLPGYHYPWAYLRARSAYVPVLVTPHGAISDSTRILKHLDQWAPVAARLYPDDASLRAEVLALEEGFDTGVGIDGRRWIYSHYFERPKDLLALAAEAVPAWERVTFRAVFPAFRAFAARRLHVEPEEVRAGLARCFATFERVGATLADGRRYLVGDRFSAADLTFASLAAPLVVPPEYGAPLPSLDELPGEVRPTIDCLRATSAGQFALRLFAEQRRGLAGA